MRRIERLTQRNAAPSIGSFQDWASYVTSFSFGAVPYTVGASDGSLDGLVSTVHRKHGPVAGAIAARGSLMSQIVPVWRNNSRSSPEFRRLFGTESLSLIEKPLGITKEQLFAQVETHIAFAGVAYLANYQGGLELLRPDRVDAVVASTVDTDDADVVLSSGDLLGYRYWKNGRDKPATALLPNECVAFIPEPSATNPFVGEAWIHAVVRDVAIASAANVHMESFFSNAATPRTIIRPSKDFSAGQVGEFQEQFDRGHSGSANAYKTAWIGGGSDISVIGSSLSDLDLRHVTGGVDTAVTVRSRVPASVLGTREGLQGSALNSGNYTATRRLWADGWFTPYAGAFLACLERLIEAPTGPVKLTYDPDEILFLQEDRKDAAEIMQIRAGALRQLIDAGFDPETAVDAVATVNLPRLSHTGLTSVQLLPPGTTGDSTNE